MEQNQTLDELSPTNVNPKIYSRQAIFGFTILFSPLAGGILLSQNLRDIGKKKKANSVLIIAISITLILFIIPDLPNLSMQFIPLIYNGAAAMFFSEYYFKKYFPLDSDYEKRKIWKPLLICIGITTVIVLAAIGSDLIIKLQ